MLDDIKSVAHTDTSISFHFLIMNVVSNSQVDVMVVAAGSEAERRQAGQLSLKHRAALVDVGADYFRGHVQVCCCAGGGPTGLDPDGYSYQIALQILFQRRWIRGSDNLVFDRRGAVCNCPSSYFSKVR